MKEFYKIEKKVEDIAKIFLKRDEDGIKKILWDLTYDQETVLNELGFQEDYKQIARMLKYKILKEYKLLHKDFNFANKIDNNKYGVTTNIKDPIIRDVILEHCENVTKDPNMLRICISNLCAKKDNIEYEECRSFGFSMLEFNDIERDFLEKNIDMYCIGEILKAIQKNKYPLKRKKTQSLTQSKIYKENEEFALKLIGNKEKILELYNVLENSSFEEIENAFIGNLEGKSLKIYEVINQLKEFNIKELFEKREEIENFFKSIEKL